MSNAGDRPGLCMSGKPPAAELCHPLEWHQSCASSLSEELGPSGTIEHSGLSWEMVTKEIVSL